MPAKRKASFDRGSRPLPEAGGRRKTRKRAIQNRAVATRNRIAEGAIQVLAREGVQGLTHRAVAQAARVSLAATTYHFDTKADIVEEASRTLLDGYLIAFRRLADRIASREETRVASLDDLARRVVLNALGRERTRSLAWSELILHGGRSVGGRALAQSWYENLDSIWSEIGTLVEPGASRQSASAAIDLTVGLTFFLHPLVLDQSIARSLLAGTRDAEPLLAKAVRSRSTPAGAEEAEGPKRYVETRQKVVQAAMDIIIADGAAGVSYGRVAEVAGMVRSGPSYYFPTIDRLLETAQLALFERAKDRYRIGFGAAHPADIDKSRLLDLTTAIFHREALEFGRESLGHYSVWIRAAQNPALRAAVAASLLDQHRAWKRRLASIFGTKPDPAVAMRMQALFIGKLIRVIASPVSVGDLSGARADFAAALETHAHH